MIIRIALFLFLIINTSLVAGCSSLRGTWDELMFNLHKGYFVHIHPEKYYPHYSHLYVLGDSLSDTGVLLGSVNQIWNDRGK